MLASRKKKNQCYPRSAISAFGCLLLSSFVSKVSAMGTPITVINPGFEANPAPVPSDITSGLPSGWAAFDPHNLAGKFYGSLYAAPDNYPLGAPQGTHAQVNFTSNSSPANLEFGIRQTLGAVLEENRIYVLTVEVGNIASGFNDLNATPDNPSDDSFFDIAGFNGYRVALAIDSASINTTTLASSSLSVAEGNPIPDGEFRTVSVTVDSRKVSPDLYGEQLEIRLVNLNEIDPIHPNSDRETNFDNVSLSMVEAPTVVAQVPFPAAGASLKATAILGLGRNSLKGSSIKANQAG